MLQIGPRESKGPPLALAGAMMKDKKPFTYTPGKIDLSEIRNPRMARRLLMNAQAEGVTSVPSSPSGNPSTPPIYLPPAALAAMNSAMAIPVLPQGAFNFRNKSVPKEKPEFMRSPSENQERQQAGMIQQMRGLQQQQQQQQRVQRGQSPSTSASTNTYNSLSSGSSDVNSRQSASYPHPGTTYMQSQQQLSTGNIGTETSRRSPSPLTPELHPRGPTGLGLRPTQTKATTPAPGQNLGSIYIPPNEHQMRQSIFSDRPPTSSVSPNSLQQAYEHTHATCSPMSESSLTTSLPASAQLTKAPTPWMNSYNRIQPLQPQQQPPSQSPLPASGNVGGQNVNVTPWGIGLSGTGPREPGELLHNLAHNNSSASGAAPPGRSSSAGFSPITNPLLPTPAGSPDSFSKQEANVGVQRLPREDSFYNYVPSQSKSFKVIQQITNDEARCEAMEEEETRKRDNQIRNIVIRDGEWFQM
ncbi:unnamed protein product [Allacma fusca]|uniref:Uncharacterized protein n=1 Tax=Allacma fusca TaxID=39272 RepID=A0A8J2NXI6_9HEXA|nr:unnamed protein product [Allacma fusca]